MTIDAVAVWLVDALRVRRLIPVLNKYLFDLLTVTLGLGVISIIYASVMFIWYWKLEKNLLMGTFS